MNNLDKRHKARSAYLSGRFTYEQIAKRFNVSTRTINRWSVKDGWSRRDLAPIPKPFTFKSSISVSPEKVFCDEIQSCLSRVLESDFQLSPVRYACREYQLPDGKRIDFVAFHRDYTVSIIEVKVGQSAQKPYLAIGQILDYYCTFVEFGHYPPESIRLILLCDEEVNPELCKSFALTNPVIQVLSFPF
jgi:hypothetical protein